MENAGRIDHQGAEPIAAVCQSGAGLLREMLEAMRDDRDAWREQAGKVVAPASRGKLDQVLVMVAADRRGVKEFSYRSRRRGPQRRGPRSSRLS